MQQMMNFQTTELYSICRQRNPTALRKFIRDFPNFNLEIRLDQYENTALHCVTARNCLECVDVLLRAGAKVDSIGGYGNTPLHTAAYLGHMGIVERLLQANAPVDVGNQTGSTPSHLAAEGGHLDVLERFMEVGASVDVANNLGKTPLHEACTYGHAEVVRRLLAADVDKDRKDTWGGFSPLHLAVMSGHVEVVKILLRAGVDVGALDGAGKNALDLAQRNCHDSIRHALVEALLRETTTDQAASRRTIEDLQWQVKSLKQKLDEIRETASATAEIGEEVIRDLEGDDRSNVIPIRRSGRPRSRSLDLSSTISEFSAPSNFGTNLSTMSELLASPRYNKTRQQQQFRKFNESEDDELELRGWLVQHLPNLQSTDIGPLMEGLKKEGLGSLRMLRLAKDHITEALLLKLGVHQLGTRLGFLDALHALPPRSRSASVSSFDSGSTSSRVDIFREHLHRLRALSDVDGS